MEENDKLLRQLRPEHRLMVDKGEYSVHPGQNYPVLRWAESNTHGRRVGALAKGTGQAPGQPVPTQLATQAFSRRTSAYRELLPEVIPATSDPEIRGSAGWLLAKLIDVIEGKDIESRVECPHCAFTFQHTVKGRPDPNYAFKLFELVAGRAPEHRDVNVAVADLTAMLNEDLSALEVYEVTPEEAQRRATVDFTD